MSERLIRPHSFRWIATAVWLLILFIPVAGHAQPQAAMPLAPGNSWTFAGDQGSLTLTVVDEVRVLDRTAYRVVFDRGRADLYEEYLSWNDRGELLLHARQATGAAPVVFDPPLVWYQAGMQTGRGGVVDLHATFDGSDEPVEAVYFVAFMGMEEVSTPVGDFDSCHVIEMATDGDSRWYHPQAGLVKVSYPLGGGPYVLVGSDLTVAVEESTWSGVKAMYR